MKPRSAAACCTLAAVLALCVILQPLGAKGRVEEEGSSEGAQRKSYVLLLYSGGEEVAGWFSATTEDALLAVSLACDDITALVVLAGSGSILSTIEVLEEAFVGRSIQVNSSVVVIVSGDCTNASCHARTLPQQLPVVSYSPSCLGATTNTTSATGAAETEALSSYQFCMLPSLDHLPAGIAGLISQFDWQRAAVLSEEGSSLVMNSKDLLSELHKADISDIRQSSLSSADALPSDILHRDYRIVVLNLTPPLARAVLCEAFHQNRTQHVWIVPGWYPHGWWLGGSPAHDPDLSPQSLQSCSDKDLERFLGEGRRTLSVLQSPLHPPQDNTSAVFQERCTARGIVDCAYAAYAYDAMWTVANAVNSLNFDLLYMAISESNFSGASGQVEFDSAGYRQWGGSYDVAQNRYGEEGLESVPIATLTEATNEEGSGETGEEEEEGGRGLLFAYVGNESQESVWPDGVPPDGSPIEQMKHPLLVLVVIAYVMSGAVMVFAVICIAFNICFRNKKLIQLTSPALNILIAVGVILMNTGTLMSMYPALFESALHIFCLVRPWVISIGWSLCLSTISVKMWRVYIIYRTTMKPQNVMLKRFIRDWHLVVVILVLVVLDVVVLVVGTTVPSARFYAEEVLDNEFPPRRNSEGILVESYNMQCSSESGLIWVAVLAVYKVILQISGMVLAFLSRKVKVKGLNESREVQVLMIVTTPIVVVALALRLVLSDYLNVVGTVWAFGVAIIGGSALVIIFLPKMVELYKNPSGDRISKYHHEDLGATNKLGFSGGHSPTNMTALSNFEPTSTVNMPPGELVEENLQAISEADESASQSVSSPQQLLLKNS